VKEMYSRDNGKTRLHNRFIKSYRKNTIAIFLSFVLTFMLLTAMLVMLHTNHRIDNIQSKMEFTPSDCYISGLPWKQTRQLKEDTMIEKLAVEQEGDFVYEYSNQSIYLTKGDGTSITMMATVIDGRLPKQEGEVAAERWMLLNLGIEPVIGRSFTMKDYNTGETKEFKLAGILSDMYMNKRAGVLRLYAPVDKKIKDGYVAYIQFKKNVDYDAGIEALRTSLGVAEKQIKECPAKEDFKELYQTDAKVISVILIVCMVVFYGVYRIASITRSQQYGILRAVGMKKGQLQKMILLELYQIYWVGVPAGIGTGLLISDFILAISGDRNMEIYLYNEKVKFHIIVPVQQIFICVIIVAFLTGLAGYMAGRHITGKSIVETVSGNYLKQKERRSFFILRASGGKLTTLFQMGCKYIFKDVKTSIMAAFTICLGMTLFTGLVYRAQTLKTYREDTKEMWYLNGQYAITAQYFDSAMHGISRKTVEDIRKIPEITSVKTAAGVPIRVIDEDNVARNDSYYNDFNRRLKEIYGYTNSGYDGKEQVYKSVLYGYNKEALASLEKHVISGKPDLKNMGEDEVIMSVYRTDDTKENKNPGSYREGTPLMEYKTGDTIRVKYRADFNTDTYEYEAFEDFNDTYIYKTYKIVAIVSFPYMHDYNMTEYPLLITDDEQIKKTAPEGCYQCIYADGKEGMSLKQQMELEQQLIKICNQDKDVSTRSLISEIKQNEMFYHKQMVYVCGIAVVAFVLVMINMVNNLKYRMQIRTREICMLRATGMSIAMVKKMMLFENMLLGATGIVTAFILTQPVLRYLYMISDMKAFGHIFHYNYAAFAVVALGTLFICAILSLRILEPWKSGHIVEGIGRIE